MFRETHIIGSETRQFSDATIFIPIEFKILVSQDYITVMNFFETMRRPYTKPVDNWVKSDKKRL